MNTHQGALVSRQHSNGSLCIDPLTEPRQDCGGDVAPANLTPVAGKENEPPNVKGEESSVLGDNKEDCSSKQSSKTKPKPKPLRRERALRPSSLQFCMQMNEFESGLGSKARNEATAPGSENPPHSVNIWDYSDSEAAPASSWATLPNKTLLCRPLPVDIEKCSCVIVKEAADGATSGTLFSLYTNEGKGRQDRKLAVACCKRRNGKSVFTVAQSVKGASSSRDESLVGTVTANLMGSKYQIWDQGITSSSSSEESRNLLAVVTFMPTIATWTGSFRNMRAYVPKHQSMQLKNPSQVQHIRGLPNDWDEKVEKVHQLISRVPLYNTATKQYELDFRDTGKSGYKVQRSVKNFQLKLEENGKQTILQLGRVDKSKYIMDYRYPLTGYQAFCICLASIDSKLCCTV
ncbi:hypothetical protein MLD38_031558 [Melastoma candidum]|uniref:Uncharacterized protein n=1 Tax=Melastoma candidum TaxID=119954 RepID=A0ACB9MR94_9MYRT|nr:hypothetical protein MLD38_031558 [Melastoma candidum]